jgi:integrase
MPATQRGQVYRLGPDRWGIRYYGPDGKRHKQSPFPSKSAAFAWFRDVIEPQLRGEAAPVADLTLAAFVPLYLERHGSTVRPRTITTLTVRLRPVLRTFGDIPLSELARMAADIAAWRTTLPERTRYAYMSALRQCLDAAVRWGYMNANPAKLAGPNRQPAPRTVRTFTRAELDAIAAELHPRYAPLSVFAASTGLRPEEWQALERRDVDRGAGMISVARTVSGGETVDLGKTTRSRGQVPLSKRALAALDAIPPRLDTSLIFPAPNGGPINLDNFRRRVWAPAIEASGVPTPARLYDLRSTFASEALAAGVTVFELARVMGTSVEMIERHYGHLVQERAAEALAGLAL